MEDEEQVVKQGTSVAPLTPAPMRPPSTVSPKAVRRGKGGQQAGKQFYFGEQMSKSRPQEEEEEEEQEKSRRLRTETEREHRSMLLEIFKAVHSRRRFQSETERKEAA